MCVNVGHFYHCINSDGAHLSSMLLVLVSWECAGFDIEGTVTTETQHVLTNLTRKVAITTVDEITTS